VFELFHLIIFLVCNQLKKDSPPNWRSVMRCAQGIEGITGSCDMWSIGVMLYVFLCGFPPFQADSEVCRGFTTFVFLVFG
jgi:serine/threonine protein kinase